MFKWATFRVILLPSSGNVNDYVDIVNDNVNDYADINEYARYSYLRCPNTFF